MAAISCQPQCVNISSVNRVHTRVRDYSSVITQPGTYVSMHQTPLTARNDHSIISIFNMFHLNYVVLTSMFSNYVSQTRRHLKKMVDKISCDLVALWELTSGGQECSQGDMLLTSWWGLTATAVHMPYLKTSFCSTARFHDDTHFSQCFNETAKIYKSPRP